MRKIGFPQEMLVVQKANKKSVVLYDFDRRRFIEINYQAFLIMDIVNTEGSDEKLLSLISDEDAKQKIQDIIEQAKTSEWLVNVDRPSLYYFKEMRITPELELIQWELTNQCNLRCIHCYNESCETNDTQELSTDEVKKIIDQADEIGVWQFDLTGGEIFMRSDIMEILKYLHEKHFAVRIATNGTLIDDEIIVQLEQLKIRAYTTSLDGGSSKTNDFFRGANGAFKKTYENLLKVKNSSIPIRRVNVTATTLNEHEMDAIHSMYTSQGIKYVVDNIVPSGRGEDAVKYNVSNDDLIQYKLRSYMEGNEDNYRLALVNSIGQKHQSGVTSCGVFRNRIFIMASGEYTFCPTLSGREHENFKLGDSRKTSLKQAWENAQTFINHINTDCGNLDNCKYAIICKGGCRSRAYITSGRFDGPDKVICEYMQHLEKRVLSGRVV